MTTPPDPTGVRRLVETIDQVLWGVGVNGLAGDFERVLDELEKLNAARAAVRVSELERVVEAGMSVKAYRAEWDTIWAFMPTDASRAELTRRLELLEEALAALDERGTT